MKEDSTEIRKQLDSNQLVNNLVFNKYYYSLLTKIGASSIAYLSEDGRILYQKPITEFHNNEISIIDSIYNNDVKFKTDRPLYVEFKKNLIIKYNFSLGYVKLESKNGSIKYEANDENKDLSIKSLNTIYPGFYDYTAKGVNLGMPSAFFKPKMGGIYFNNDTALFVMKIPYSAFSQDPELRRKMNGDSIMVDNKYAVVKSYKDLDAKAYPLRVEDTLKGKQSTYAIAVNSFAMPNDSTFLFFYTPNDWKQFPNERKYIASFKLKNGVLEYDHHLKNEIADIYITSKIGYRFSNVFRSYDYPYYISTMGTQISNLETEKDYTFMPQFKVNYSQVDSTFTKKIVSGKVSYPIFNIALYQDNKNNILYLFSKVESVIYLTVLSRETMLVKQTINLNKKGINMRQEASPIINYDKDKESFSIEDKDGNMRTIPVALLLQ
jgi:hypothetical protein